MDPLILIRYFYYSMDIYSMPQGRRYLFSCYTCMVNHICNWLLWQAGKKSCGAAHMLYTHIMLYHPVQEWILVTSTRILTSEYLMKGPTLKSHSIISENFCSCSTMSRNKAELTHSSGSKQPRMLNCLKADS